MANSKTESHAKIKVCFYLCGLAFNSVASLGKKSSKWKEGKRRPERFSFLKSSSEV